MVGPARTDVQYRVGSGTGDHFLPTLELGSATREIQSAFTGADGCVVGRDRSHRATDRGATTSIAPQ